MQTEPAQTPERPMMNVLVIAYYFPPMGLSGVQRTLKFVKYLPQHGWRPIVLTAGETPYYAHDESLLAELAPLVEQGLVRIVRTAQSGAPGAKIAKKEGNTLKLPSAWYQRLRSKAIQTVLQPDSRIGWKKHALALADTIFEEERIDAIMSTAPPYTDHLIARALRRKYDVPYLVDYRDAWVGNPVLNFYATPFHKAYARKLEDDVLRSSSAITVASRRMKEILLKNYTFLSHEDVQIISHGYDPDDLGVAYERSAAHRKPERFRVTYGGAFYVGRTPHPMFEAARLAITEEPGLATDLELVFAGIMQQEFLRMAEKAGLAQTVVSTGYLEHRENVALLMASDVLWMTMSDDISAPGKLYEYLGTGKPILGLVPPGGVADRLLEEYGAGFTAAPEDIRAIADHLITLYRAWKAKRLPEEINIPFVKQFDRRTLTRELARQLGLMITP